MKKYFSLKFIFPWEYNPWSPRRTPLWGFPELLVVGAGELFFVPNWTISVSSDSQKHHLSRKWSNPQLWNFFMFKYTVSRSSGEIFSSIAGIEWTSRWNPLYQTSRGTTYRGIITAQPSKYHVILESSLTRRKQLYIPWLQNFDGWV